MEYVYLVASLPTLALTDPPPFSPAELLGASRGLLRDDHWHDLRALVEDRPQDARSSEAQRCVRIEARLRNALARGRARRAGADPTAHVRPPDELEARAEDAAARALATDDPLARELLLDRYRWTQLDEIAAFRAFGVQAVFAYACKLQLAEKWAGLREDRGMAAARAAVDGALAGSLP